MRLAEFKMRLFVFFADRLLQWGRRVEQEAGYSRHEALQETTCDPWVEPLRRDFDRDGPPEHWARLVRSEPPPHWLELFRRATATEQPVEDSGSLDEPVALDELENYRSAVDSDSSEAQPKEEIRPRQTPRNRTDYSASREAIRDFSRPVTEAATPARFLDRLHFSAEPPAPRKLRPDYVAGKPAAPAKPGVYPIVPLHAGNESERFSGPAVPPSPARGQNNFPVRPPIASQSHFLDLGSKKPKAAPAANTVERILAAERPGERVEDIKRAVGSESRARTTLEFEGDQARPNRARAPEAETQNQFTNPRRYFSRRSRESAQDHQPEYPQKPEFLQTARQFSARARPSLGTPPSRPQSNNQQPITQVDIDSQPRRRLATVAIPAQAIVQPSESALKFSEHITGERSAAPHTNSNALPENSQFRRRVAEYSDLNKDYWPTLPPAPLFDSDDDLFARETEAETLQRLEQEQRGTLWSE